MANPQIFITVDVEEIFDWGVFDQNKVEIPNRLNLQPFQSICNRYGTKPIYFITYPIMNHTGLVAELQEIYQRGECELGIHIHTWTTPPNLSSYDLFSSYQGNLPYSLERQKIEAAVEKFEQVFGFQPICHRSGRFGCGPNTFKILKDVGITDDFSPSAEFDFSYKSGPDFSEVSSNAFVDEPSGIRCYPVTGQKFISGPDWVNSILHRSKVFDRIPEFLARRVVRLTPEGNSARRLIFMCNNLMAEGLREFVFTLHATSFLSDGNPYTSKATHVESILQTTADFLDYFFSAKGGEGAVLSVSQKTPVLTADFTEYLREKRNPSAKHIGDLSPALERNGALKEKSLLPELKQETRCEPLVSAIIPTFNRKNKTRRAIQSVLLQTYPNIEVIVVDDGSTDDTGQMVRHEFPEVIYHFQENAGVSAARNKGVSLSNGEYIAFLDSDDQWYPGKTAAQMEVLRRYPDLKICWADASAIGENGEIIEERFLRRYHNTAYSYQPDRELFWHVDEISWRAPLLKSEGCASEAVEVSALLKIGDFSSRMYLGNFMLTPTMVVSKATFEKVGGFSTTVRVGEDYDFNARACLLGNVGLLDHPLCATQLGGGDHLRSLSLDMARANLQTMMKLKERVKPKLNLPKTLINKRERNAFAWLGTWELDSGDRKKARSYLYSGIKLFGQPTYRILALFILSLFPRSVDTALRGILKAARGS